MKVNGMRLDRYLSNMGRGSRSQVKRLIRSGQVTVNSDTCRNEAMAVDPGSDEVTCAGEIVVYREFIYLMLNKPAGVLTATEDGRGRTVLDLIGPEIPKRGLFPVGRLDKDTEGLLLLTNHGELGHRLLAPQNHVPKRYYARVTGAAGTVDQQAFATGVELDDGYRTLPAGLELISSGEVSEVIVEIHEGKFHQIKRMFQTLGKRVLYLKRLTMGPLCLDESLTSGSYRELTADEIKAIND
ncbi:MAG TPA: pseudouridine synthase, partial [Verrucomicrobiae bacterium]